MNPNKGTIIPTHTYLHYHDDRLQSILTFTNSRERKGREQKRKGWNSQFTFHGNDFIPKTIRKIRVLCCSPFEQWRRRISKAFTVGGREGGEWIRRRRSLEPFGERGLEALATGFIPVESRHVSVRTSFSKNVRFSSTAEEGWQVWIFFSYPYHSSFFSSCCPRVLAVFFSYPFLFLLYIPSLSYCGSATVDEREEDPFLRFAGNRFLSYVKLQDGSSTFLPPGSLFLLLPKFIGGNVLFTL